MIGPVGLWRAVVRRSAADLPVVAATWLLLVSAITLLAGGVIYGDASAQAGLRRGVLAAPGTDRSVVVSTSTTGAQLAGLDSRIREALAGALEPAVGPIDLVLRVDGLAPPGTGDDVVDRMSELASFEGIREHSVLSAGRWATPGKGPLEATLSEGAAGSLGLAVGDRIALAARGDASFEVDLVLVGTWRPRPDDGYWRGSALDLAGIEEQGRFVTRGPFVVDPADLVRLDGRRLDAQWVGQLDASKLTIDGVGAVQSGLAGLAPGLDASMAPGQSVQTRSNLSKVLDAVSHAVLVGRSGVLLLTVQFGVLAGYAVVLVAGILVERRRTEVALLRARGATSRHLAALAFGEALLVTVPAAALAPPLAAALIRLLDIAGPLASSGLVRDAAPDSTSFAVAALAGGACLLALTLPALGSGSSPTQARAATGRQPGRTLGQRLGIDVALLVVAGIALWQLRLYGGPLTRNIRGAIGLDPLLVAAPGIGLLAGAVAGTRFFPRVAETAERWLGRRRGLVPALGARHLSRRPLRSTRSALLLMLAAALGTFAAIYGATWRQSQEDQAAYEAPSGIRLTAAYHPDLPTLALGGAYRSIAGVTAATPVARRSLEVGRSFDDGQLLAIDATAIPALMPSAPDGSDHGAALVRSLADARSLPSAIPLPNDPARLAIAIDLHIQGSVESGAAGDPGPVDVALVIEGADGLERIDGGSVAANGGSQRLEVPIAGDANGVTASPAGPLALEAIELSIAPPDGVTATGTMSVTGIEITPVAGATKGTAAGWVPVPFDAGATGWGWTVQSGADLRAWDSGNAPARVSIGLAPGDVVPPGSAASGAATTLRLWARVEPAAAMRAVVSDGLLQGTGATVGETIAGTSLGDPLALEAVSSIGPFPSLDPSRPFAIVDRLTWQLDRLARSGSIDPPEEWWIAADPAMSAAAAAELRLAPYSASAVLDRTEMLADRTTDPIPLGLIGALALGSLAALTIAGIGFVVSATESATERVGEFAILRALGLSSRALSAWLALESAVLLGFGLLAGTVLGLVLAWLVLPFATLTPTGVPPVPAAVLVIPPWSFVPLLALAVVLLIISALAASRQVPAVGLGRLLRAEDT